MIVYCFNILVYEIFDQLSFAASLNPDIQDDNIYTVNAIDLDTNKINETDSEDEEINHNHIENYDNYDYNKENETIQNLNDEMNNSNDLTNFDHYNNFVQIDKNKNKIFKTEKVKRNLSDFDPKRFEDA